MLKISTYYIAHDFVGQRCKQDLIGFSVPHGFVQLMEISCREGPRWLHANVCHQGGVAERLDLAIAINKSACTGLPQERGCR